MRYRQSKLLSVQHNAKLYPHGEHVTSKYPSEHNTDSQHPLSLKRKDSAVDLDVNTPKSGWNRKGELRRQRPPSRTTLETPSLETFHTSVQNRFKTLKAQLTQLRLHHGKILGPVPSERYQEASSQDLEANGTFDVTFYIIPRVYEPCIRPLSSLKPIKIRDLAFGVHHIGKKLTAKVIAKPMNGNGINVALEDVNKDGVIVILYNTTLDLKPAEICPLGALVVIKQPFLELRTDVDGNYSWCLRVDHVSDLHILVAPQYVGRKLGLTEWNEEGNHKCRQGDWFGALSCYSQGIQQSAMTDETADADLSLLRNRALVLQENLRNEAAFKDTCLASMLFPGKPLPDISDIVAVDRIALDKPPYDGRIERCRARAQYNMRSYKLCIETLKRLLQDDGHRLDGKSYQLYQRAHSRCDEERHGIYNWADILQRLDKDIIANDVAPYTRLTEVQPTEGMGRGLFSRTSIVKGSIIMVEKAFEFARGAPIGVVKNIHTIHDLSQDAAEIYSGESFLQKVIFKLQNMGSEWRERFFDLHSGGYGNGLPKKAPEIDGQVVIDSFLVHKIICLNSMHFGPASDKERDRGIWIHASYANHSCEANCKFDFYGDMLVMRPQRDIKAWEQLTVNYVSSSVDPGKRRAILKASWGFDCTCSVCKGELLSQV